MTPQEKTIQKARFIQSAIQLGSSLKQAEKAYKGLTETLKSHELLEVEPYKVDYSNPFLFPFEPWLYEVKEK